MLYTVLHDLTGFGYRSGGQFVLGIQRQEKILFDIFDIFDLIYLIYLILIYLTYLI